MLEFFSKYYFDFLFNCFKIFFPALKTIFSTWYCYLFISDEISSIFSFFVLKTLKIPKFLISYSILTPILKKISLNESRTQSTKIIDSDVLIFNFEEIFFTKLFLLYVFKFILHSFYLNWINCIYYFLL